MLLRIPSIAFGVILTTQCNLVSAQDSQESLSVTQQAITDFRQLSVRVLSAYKVQPHYIGSTEKWHLFLKKESRQAVDKEFSSIFGYKISTQGASIKNGWGLNLGMDINPDNCPEVTHYKDDKTGFTLPSAPTVKTQCLTR
jgi:hypothetical protein